METNFGDLQFNRNRRDELGAAEVARGQKFVIFAVLMNVMIVGLAIVIPEYDVPSNAGAGLALAFLIGSIAAFAMAIYGVVKISNGLGWNGFAKVVTVVLLLVPLVSLITLLVVNGRATSFLKRSGYKVGLTGARK